MRVMSVPARRSRRSPARFEGTLRRHMQMPGVGVRDSAYYSVIEGEWPGVRANLERRLGAGERSRAESTSS